MLNVIEQLLTFRFLIAAVIIIVIPGPSVMFTVGRALAYGARTAVLTVVGNTLGALVIGAAVVAGLGVLLQGRPSILAIVQMAGAGYLVYLGVDAWRHRAAAVAAGGREPEISVGTVMREGFAVGVTNPKTIIFFTAVIPQFVREDLGSVPAQLLILIVCFEVIALVSDSLWGILAATGLRTWARTPGQLSAIVGVGAFLISGLGLWLLALSIQMAAASGVLP